MTTALRDSALPHRRRSRASSFLRSIASASAVNILPLPSASFIFRRPAAIAIFCIAASVAFCVLYHSSYTLHILRRSTPSSFLPYLLSSFTSPKVSEEVKLRKVLSNAATEDNTVILTTLNDAWAVPNSVLDLFLESFRIGNGTERLLRHLVIIALDGEAYKRCLVIHPHCYSLVSKGIDFSQEAFFMTGEYLHMMWRRIDFLRSVLEMGYNFVFTDADIMWFRDPFPRFYSDIDFQIACDHFTGSPDDTNNSPNGGFNYVKSNNRSILFYKYWYSSRETYPEQHDQDVLNLIKGDHVVESIGVTMKFLDTNYFGGLCEPSKNLNEVCTMHANCCLGMANKIADLKIMLQDWKIYLSLPPLLKRASILSWRVPQNCSIQPQRRFMR